MEAGKRIVILGAGFGGLVTAILLSKRLSKQHEIILVDQNDAHTYTPWLYDTATSFLLHKKKHVINALTCMCCIKLEDILETWHDARLRFRKGKVVDVKKNEQEVLFADGKTLAYDVLVVALGAQTAFYGIEGVEEHALVMKGMNGCTDIQNRIATVLNDALKQHDGEKTIVIIGAGATGSETATELMNYLRRCDNDGMDLCRRVRVMLLDAGPKILGQFSPHVQVHAVARMKKLGIDLRPNSAVVRVDNEQIFTKSDKIPYDVLIWAGGIEPNTLLAKLPFLRDDRGRLRVEPHLLAVSEHHVFALGDATALMDAHTKKPLPPTAWVAVDEAKIVAKNVQALLGKGDFVSYHPPLVYPAIIATGGKNSVGGAFGFELSGFIGFVLRRLVDLRYFFKILPKYRAIIFWWKGTVMLFNND